MGLKKFRPITPTLRHTVMVDFSELTRSRPVKSLTEALKKTGGRDNYGHISMRWIGGGHRQRYRLKVGQKVQSGPEAEIQPGNCLSLKHIPLGTSVHNVELFPGRAARVARSAGSFCQLMAREGDYAQLRLPSGEVRKFHVNCRAVVGQVGNLDHENMSLGKAGRNRWRGRLGRVRGVAMNPVDHPMGGGEGKSSGGRHPCSPWGQIAKGLKTRKRKLSDSLILRRRKK